jgi:hypothetical protein
MASKVIDLFLIYQFLKRLSTPFKEWEAYKLGIIDMEGNVLRKSNTLKKSEEKNAWGYFDRLIANLKKLLGKIPGGKSRIASYAAALLLLKEQNTGIEVPENELLEMLEEEIANIVGDGKIAGVGVGSQGEPPVSRKKIIFKKVLTRKTPNA